MKNIKRKLLVVAAVAGAGALLAAAPPSGSAGPPDQHTAVRVERLGSRMETVEIWRNGRYHPVQVEVVTEKLTDANGLVIGQESVVNPEAVEAQLPPIDPA
ncbi:MAG TPA: hypothetical protein VG455_11065, partial [Acidimicrobiales bacterium]|nr:hypothetical protein [Acidimicrobiales bacterium]